MWDPCGDVRLSVCGAVGTPQCVTVALRFAFVTRLYVPRATRCEYAVAEECAQCYTVPEGVGTKCSFDGAEQKPHAVVYHPPLVDSLLW